MPGLAAPLLHHYGGAFHAPRFRMSGPSLILTTFCEAGAPTSQMTKPLGDEVTSPRGITSRQQSCHNSTPPPHLLSLHASDFCAMLLHQISMECKARRAQTDFSYFKNKNESVQSILRKISCGTVLRSARYVFSCGPETHFANTPVTGKSHVWDQWTITKWLTGFDYFLKQECNAKANFKSEIPVQVSRRLLLNLEFYQMVSLFHKYKGNNGQISLKCDRRL